MSADDARCHRGLAAAVRRRVGGDRRRAVALALAVDHPLARRTRLVGVLARQAATTGAVVAVGAIATLQRREWGPSVLGVAVLLTLALIAALVLARQARHEDILRLVAAGQGPLGLADVAHEADRLVGSAQRAALARRLDRALADAHGWHQIAVAQRPPPGIRLLVGLTNEVEDILERVQGGDVAPGGLALLELMLIGGYDSALYVGDRQALREQLWRVRYLLDRGGGACD